MSSKCFYSSSCYREERSEVKDNLREVCDVYHQLQKLHLMGYAGISSHALGLYLTLANLNVAHTARVRGWETAKLHSGTLQLILMLT